MSAYSGSNVPSTAQYVYAKCAKNGTTGTWLVTDQAIIFDSDPSYYHFLVGSLSSVDSVSNTRNFAATYGFTTINGRNITTGVIRSSDGSSVIIDLDAGIIKGNITFESGTTSYDALQSIIGNNSTVQTAATTANTANATANRAEGKIDGLEIGGRNLVLGTATDLASGGDATRLYNMSPAFAAASGETFVVSFDIILTGSMTFSGSNSIFIYEDTGKYWWLVASGTYAAGTYHKEIKTNAPQAFTNAATFRRYCRATADRNILTISNVKVEKGTIATDWTPAPEDTDYLKNALAEATEGSTDINGGLILTKMIIAGKYQNQSGMAGVEASSVAFWAGGSLNGAEAMSTPVVIKKDGTTRLGVLRLSSSGNITMPVGGKSRLNITGGSLPAPSIDNWTGDSWATASSVPSVTLIDTPQILTMQVVYGNSGKRGHNGMPVYGTGSGYFAIRKTSSGTGTLGEVTLQMKAGETYNQLQKFNLYGAINDSNWHYAALNFSSVSTPYNETESLSGIAVVLQISGSGTFECTFFSSTSGARSGNYGVHVWWASDITVPITTLANNGLMVLYDGNNYFRTTQVGSALRTTIKGETDIPGVLWAGTITNQAGVTPHYKNSAKYASNQLACDTWNSTNKYFRITHRLGSADFAAMVTPSSSAVTVRTTKDSTYLYVYLSAQASFDLVLFGTN
jgi:hypothetical protein